jgi:hypothetical protein
MGFVAEQTTFVLSFILWISVFGGDSATRANRSGSGVIALLLTV